MNNKSGKKSGLVIFMLIFLIIVMIGVGVYAYFFTDLLKTPEQLFKKYFLSNVFQLADMNFAPFDEIKERSENEVTEYSLNLKFDAIEGIIDESYDANFTLTTDYKNRNEDLKFLLNKDEKEFFKANLALTDETLGLKVPDLYEKYIAIENKNLKKMAENLELSEEIIETIPDKIPTGITKEEEEKVKALAQKYITKIMDQFDESSYMAEKNINIKVNSKDFAANKYTLSISSRKIYTVVTETFLEVLDDPEFVALVSKNFNEEQLGTIKTAYKDMLKDTKAEDLTDTIIKFSVYETNGKTIKTEIKVDENEAYFSILDNQIIFSTEEPKSESNAIGYSTIAIIKNVFENDEGKLTYEIEKTYNKNDIEDFQAEYDAKYSDSQFEDVFTTNYSDVYKDSKIKFIVSTKKTNNDTIKGEIKFDSDSETGLGYISALLNLNFKCQFGKGKVEIISNDNAEILNDFTLEELQVLVAEIGANIMNLPNEKPDSLIGTILIGQNEPEQEIPSYDNTDDFYTSDEDDNFTNDDFTTEETDDNYLEDNQWDFPESYYYYDDTISEGPILDGTKVNTRESLDAAITNALNILLDQFRNELYINENTNFGDYLNIDNIQNLCGDEYDLELIDSTTIKVNANVYEGNEYIFYVLMDINGETFELNNLEILDEVEYSNR